jgi:GT2 family glycosyltransferase
LSGAPPPGAYDADVVILALDRPAETRAAIESVLCQAGVAWHLVVVDQGSQPAALAALAALLHDRHDATLIALGHNVGVAAGRNHGSAVGHGRVIVGLDNDAGFATPDTLARLVAAVDEAPDLAAVGCRIVSHATGADDLSSWGYRRRLLPRAGDCFDAATFVGAGHAIRRLAWADTGPYDAVLFFCWEELDFCARAIARGWRVRYRGDIVIRHRVSTEQRVAWSGARWFYFMRNRLYVGRKLDASWPELLPRCALYLLRAWRDGAAWHAWHGALASLALDRSRRQAVRAAAAHAREQREEATAVAPAPM